MCFLFFNEEFYHFSFPIIVWNFLNKILKFILNIFTYFQVNLFFRVYYLEWLFVLFILKRKYPILIKSNWGRKNFNAY